MPRIFYECRDLEFPVGGVRRLYRHVEILAKAGFDARILHHSSGFRTRWFESSAPIDAWVPGYTFLQDDILVIPEGHADVMRLASSLPCRKVVIALNWGNIFGSLWPGEDWRQFDIHGVIAGSNYESYFIEHTMGLPSVTIASGIDTNMFCPAQAKNLSVSYMPRKNNEYFRMIAGTFRAKFPQHDAVQFVPIDMLEHSDVAHILGKSSIFLAHTFPEGLSRKTLEAMACGNIVVGFAGHGSLECMTHSVNCYLASDGDVLDTAELLAAAVNDCVSGASYAMSQAAIGTAKNYSLEREEKAVKNYWDNAIRTLPLI